MTENFYSTNSYKPNYSTFSGDIYESDFNGYVSLSEIAKRIEQDKRFDIFCNKRDEERKRQQNHKERMGVKSNGK